MSVNSRNKGKRFELTISHILQEHGFDARRGQQFSGANGDADVVGLPGIHIEAKAVENLNIYKAYEQSVGDAREGETPVVVFKKNRKPILIAMSFEEFLEKYYEGWELREKG